MVVTSVSANPPAILAVTLPGPAVVPKRTRTEAVPDASVVTDAAVPNAPPGLATVMLSPTKVTARPSIPAPDAFVIAGVASGTPFQLSHERSLVVDRYRPGVVM